MRTAKHSIATNILLAAFKLFAGIFAHSAAMVADAIHSITDLISTIIVIIGIKLSNKKPDRDHQYGHERIECVAALILAALIFSVGVGIGWSGVQRIISGDYQHLAVPGILALIAALASIIVKESLYWYVRATAKKINSSALMADAWHSRIDGLSSIGSFFGILGARLGFPILDSVAAIIICLFIFKAAYSIARDAINKMLDTAADDATLIAMRKIILSHKSVQSIDQIKTRLFGNRIFVDIEISVDPSLDLLRAHEISHQIHDLIESNFPTVKHCSVHLNPAQPKPPQKALQ